MKRHRSLWFMLGIWGLLLLVNLLARLCQPAVDWYIMHVFPLISGLWSHVSGIFPFSVGEWMIVIGLVQIGLAVIGFPLILIFGRSKRWKIAGITAQVYGWIITWVFCVVTTRFLVLYQGTQLSHSIGAQTYEDAQVLDFIEMIVEKTNEEAAQVARDENGCFVMTDELMPEAKACMERLAQEYPQFAGYYPDAKPIYHAYFFTQQNLLGIYYPHSMEANYNPVVYEINLPVTICHEYTHLKGNIFEDEAGYYAFLACMTSESHDFRYSGYLSLLEWFTPEFGDDEAAWERYYELLGSLAPEVSNDLYAYVPEEYMEEHQKTDEIIPSSIVSETAATVMDASLKVNGIVEGVGSYEGMTGLILYHYLH